MLLTQDEIQSEAKALVQRLKSFDESKHPRDEGGRFGAGGGGANPESNGSGKQELPKTTEALHEIADKEAKSLASKMGDILKKIPAKVYNGMKASLKKQFGMLENRYGRKSAIAIMAAGVALGVASPLVVLPGSTLLGSLPFVAIAETYLQASKLFKSAEEELSIEEIYRLAQELVDTLTKEAEKLAKGEPA